MLPLYCQFINMEEVRSIISEIGQKVTRLKNDLSQVRSENSMLKEKLQTLEARLASREQEVCDFQEKIDALEQREHSLMENQSISVSKNDEIDALVREIDTCITQLKTNNNV